VPGGAHVHGGVPPGGYRPGGSYYPHYNNYGYAPRYGYGYGYPWGSIALSLGLGRLGYGYGGLGYGGLGYGGLGYGGLGYGGLGYGGGYYNDYYGYPSAAVAVPYYVPYYVPVPGGPDYSSGYFMPPASDPPVYNPPAIDPGGALPDPRPMAAFGTARITVQVPANAKVWVDDLPTTQSGAVREFVTPPALELGKTYKYTFRAQWDENGQTITREQTVEFQSGGAVIVNLNSDPNRKG
jgi:uncharacterized protein (TIGR03000 family)